MALIKCPECGKEISDTAKNCINCGYVLKEENNVIQPQTVVIAPKKGLSAKKSLNMGVTIIFVVVLLSVAVYGFGYLLSGGMALEVSNFPPLNLLISRLLIPGIVSIAMSILFFAVPKLRKKWFEILYMIISVAVLPLTLTITVSTIPACVAYVVGVVCMIKGMLIKD